MRHNRLAKANSLILALDTRDGGPHTGRMPAPLRWVAACLVSSCLVWGAERTPLYDPVEIRLTSTRAFDNPFIAAFASSPAWPDPMDPRRRPRPFTTEREFGLSA